MADDEFAAVEALIDQPSQRPESLRSIRQTFERSLLRERSRIGFLVVCLYCFIVSATALLLIYRGVAASPGGAGAFGDLAELIKVAVVPVVTLVIGFYFGSSRSN